MAGIDWILQPNIDFTETDTRAAEQAVSGGFSGSQFGAINNLRLRDSERMNRIALGNQLLDPTLSRAHQSSMQANQIAATAAQQAVEQSGLDRRLGAENAARMQLALLNGDQAMQQQLLQEAGADRRQAASITADLQRTQIGAQNQLLTTLLQMDSRGGSGSSGDGRIAPRGTNNIGTSNPLGATYATGSSGGIPFYASTNQAYNPTARPGAGTSSGGGSTSQYTSYINQILRGYGLG